jgi:hypothetical protein
METPKASLKTSEENPRQEHLRRVAVLGLLGAGFLIVLSALMANAATITVTGTSDEVLGALAWNGTCDLREAIEAANTNTRVAECAAGDPGLDTIAFDIGTGGLQTISPIAPLQGVEEAAIIDGHTQPGCGGGPCIELDGSNAGDGADGLTLTGHGSTVRGLIINRFSDCGVDTDIGRNQTIEGNFIGTDSVGTAAAGNYVGVCIGLLSSNNMIGGTAPDSGNLISGNVGAGILNSNAYYTGTGATIQGNYIGTDVSGHAPLGNQEFGVALGLGGCNIGGTGVGEANIIAFNGEAGVMVAVGRPVNGASVIGNRIFSNGGLGIDVGDYGVNPNEPADQIQNYPELTSASWQDGELSIEGRLISYASSTYSLHFYSNTDADPSGHGEGETFIGEDTVTTDASGLAEFSSTFTVPALNGAYITATASGYLSGETSEFSNGVWLQQASAEVSVLGSTGVLVLVVFLAGCGMILIRRLQLCG